MDPFGRRSIDFNAILKSNDISPDVQKHLARVFRNLSLGAFFVAAGVAIGSTLGLGDLRFLFILLNIAGIVYLSSTRSNEIMPLRLAVFLLSHLATGLSLSDIAVLGPILLPALLLTLVIFVSFSGAALFSRRRSLLFLRGAIATGLFWLSIAGIFGLFFGSAGFFNVQLYLGLLMFVGYVAVDTQMIIERADAGERDSLLHAQELLVDLVALFVRIAAILAKNSEKKKRKN